MLTMTGGDRSPEGPSIRRFTVQGCEFAVDFTSGACFRIVDSASVCEPRAYTQEATAKATGDGTVRASQDEVSSSRGSLTREEQGTSREATRLEGQTRLSHEALLREVSLLGVTRAMSVLDVGCGTGALTGLLGMRAANVVGLDVDQANLSVSIAKTAAAGLRNVTHVLADFRNLPSLSGQFDLAVARLLFQHLPCPVEDAIHITRFVRHGGRLALIDIDQGTMVDYPDQPAALSRLHDAHIEAQRSIGGDRLVGRKLPHHMIAAGLADIAVIMLPNCTIVPPVPDIAAQSVAQFILHFSMIRDYLVRDTGAITDSHFEESIEAGIEYYGQAGHVHYSQMFLVSGTVVHRSA